MKKKFYIPLLSLALAGFFIFGQGQAFTRSSSEASCSVYFVDRQLHRLIPTPILPEKNAEKTANKIINEIISGRDKNTAILRLIPNIKDGISVKVSEDTAYVDLSASLTNFINKNGETERLIIYQIVNSLISVDGINSVQFTIGGTVRKDFMGFLDMREIFTANYNI